MKTLVAIPSKNRATLLHKRTYKWASRLKDAGVDMKIFVEPQDFDRYKGFYGEGNLVKLPEDNQGLGYCKEHIQKYAMENGYEAIFKMDDDISRLRIIHASRSKKSLYETFKPSDDSVLNSVLLVKEAIHVFEKLHRTASEVVCLSFPYAKEMWRLTPFTANRRTQTAYLCLTKWFCPPAGKTISVFEDFYIYMYLRLNNQKVVRYNLLGIECDDIGKNKGGHQSDDRKVRALKEAEILRKLYPPILFRKVNKPWQIEPDMRSIP